MAAEHKCTQKELIELNFNHIKESLSRIEEQTTKTNGRVTKLEEKSNMQAGAMKAISVVYVITIAVLTIYLTYKGL